MRLLALPLLAATLLVGGCGKETVRTADDAAAAIRKILAGEADPSDFKLADDAARPAAAILDDAPDVGRLEQDLSLGGDKACDAASIAANLGEKDEETEISLSAEVRNQIRARIQELYPDMPQSDMVFVNTAMDAVVGLTESSVTEAIDKACDAGI
jgi:hypothetical protein